MLKISLCMGHLKEQLALSDFNEGTMIQIVPSQDACCRACLEEGIAVYP